MKTSPKDLIVLNPSEYFNGLLTGALESLNVEVTEHAKFYLVSLLLRFISSENLFTRDSSGKIQDGILALKLADALQAENNAERHARLKQLGDFSLYIAGYFSDSLQRKIVDVDYYIDMGGTAYLEAASIPVRNGTREIMGELGTKFSKLVEVLSQLSEESIASQEQQGSTGLLRIYDLWSKTGSERLAKQLALNGIILEENQNKPKKQ